MATDTSSTITFTPKDNAIQSDVDISSITTTTKTEFMGFDGKVIKSTIDANGKSHHIHKVITTTITVTCFENDDLRSKNDQTPEEKFVEHVKELGTDTKTALLHTATNVQHALETAGDYIRIQLTSPSSENAEKARTTNNKDQRYLLQQASALKDIFVQKVIEAKDATVDVIKDLATPQEHQISTAEFHQRKATLTKTEKN